MRSVLQNRDSQKLFDFLGFTADSEKDQLVFEKVLSVLNSIPEGIELVSVDGNVLYINDEFENITGVKKSDRVGKNILQVNPKGVLTQILQTKKTVLGRITSVPEKQGVSVATGKPIYTNNEMIGALILAKDASELNNLSNLLNKSLSYLSELYNSYRPKYAFNDIISESNVMKRTIELAKKISPTSSTVLILGENGTGKELFAHAIHHASDRSMFPFLSINCAAIPDNLLESELFGYEKGAFTGADKTKIGLFELADKGTIFLDEIGDMQISLQSKLLRVLQEQEIRRIGGTKQIKVNIRVIAATNRNLRQLIEGGLFREDLYYRLNVVTLNIPSLRDRKDDISLLTNHFIKKYNKKFEKRIDKIDENSIVFLKNYHWPGNVRELENVIEYATLVSENSSIGMQELKDKIPLDYKNITDHLLSIDEMEQELIKYTLSHYGNTLEGKIKAANSLKISLSTLYNKIRKYRME